jgi:hypothetical protein
MKARELIPGPSLTAKTTLFSLNRMQSRVVTGLLTGQLYIIGLTENPFCRKCIAENEILAHVGVSVKLWRHLDISVWGPFFKLEDDGILSLRAI